MARRSKGLHSLAQAGREAQRQVRANAREQKKREREAIRRQKARALEAKQQYQQERLDEVDELNWELEDSVDQLSRVLAWTLGVDDYFNLDNLKPRLVAPVFEFGHLEEPVPSPPSLESMIPPEPSWLGKKMGAMSGWEKKKAQAIQTHEDLVAKWNQDEGERTAELARRRADYETQLAAHKEAVRESEAEVEQMKASFEASDPETVVTYFSLVLERSSYPDGFPNEFRLAFVPESRQLVVELQFPELTVIPTVRSYKYVKSSDTITSTARPERERRSLYENLIAQIALRTVHEIFEADRTAKIDSVVFNGHVRTIDQSTGKQVNPCLLTLRTTREAFLDLDLARVDPLACLRGLSASVSKSPAELTPVRPVLEFSMVDPRFVEEVDVISGLDQRPNLMELKPTEFESLIANLFGKMGLETRQTQASRDGGVDCVAYDPRPIFGGKVVIQAKRYKNTVGVSAVRDLFGTVQNEGASKGILVATSGYGPTAYEFAEGKPLELLSGSHLLHLLSEHAGIDAKIVPPDDWKDPAPDA